MLKILLSILLSTFILSPEDGWCVTQWNKALPATGDNLTSWPTAVTAQWSILDTLISNYKRGEKLLFNNSSTLNVAAGEVVVSNMNGSLRIFLQDTGNTSISSSNLDTGGSFSNTTTYYVYSGATSSTATSSTYYISLSSTAPTGPTYYAQLGYFITDGSGNIQTIVNSSALTTIPVSNGTSFSANSVYQNTSNQKLQVNWTGSGQCTGGWCGLSQYCSIGSTSGVGTVVSGSTLETPGSPTMGLVSGTCNVPSGYYWEVVNTAASGGGGSLTGSVSRIETWSTN